jgi:TusE/DsrC/DsvC family sulfur relay protein
MHKGEIHHGIATRKTYDYKNKRASSTEGRMGQEKFDVDGFLIDPGSWNEELAQSIAVKEGVGELNGDHWVIIRYLRQHYLNGGLPAVSHVCHVNHFDSNCLPDLFLSVKSAWRIAGLPNPGEEAKSYM